MEPGPVVVETKELTKKYGRVTALDRLTLSVHRGQILGFVGPNGAGKTTTIKILVGLARPTSGSATVAGVDCVRQARKLKRLVGYMPDTFGSYDNLRVGEYLDFFGAAFGIPRRERARRIGEMLDIAGASSFHDLYVETLSHGMKQRVAIARTLLHDPPVLILDEPANGLDPQARIEMRKLLLDLAERGKTLLVTSHILPELARICHRVAIITRGQLRVYGTLEEITRNSISCGQWRFCCPTPARSIAPRRLSASVLSRARRSAPRRPRPSFGSAPPNARRNWRGCSAPWLKPMSS